MGFFSKLLGDSTASPIKAIGNIIDDIHTSKEEEMADGLALQKVAAKLQGLQAEITKQEAAHRSVFVAGWRPFIGWVCGWGLAIEFVVAPLVHPWVELGSKDSGVLLSLVLALTGIGSLRTVEKARGISR